MLFTIMASAVLVAIDQLTKLWAVRGLAPLGAAPLLPGIIGLRYVENTGAAFSLLQGQLGLLVVVTGAALLGVGYVLLFRRPAGRMEYSALLMLFAGGLGNLIDRIANGYVVDFLELQFMRFAVFNVADILVTASFVLLIVAAVRSEMRDKKDAKAPKAAENDGHNTHNSH